MPRWSLNCFWRRDGEPIWTNPALFANETLAQHADADAAQSFLRALAQELRVAPRHVFAACEDAFYYLWRERNLPANVIVGGGRHRLSVRVTVSPEEGV